VAPGKTRQIREKQRRSETGTMAAGKTRQTMNGCQTIMFNVKQTYLSAILLK
jgi:hypothetical protein